MIRPVAFAAQSAGCVFGAIYTKFCGCAASAGAEEMSGKNELAGFVLDILKDGEALARMRMGALSMAHPDAASSVADELLNLASSQKADR